MFYCITEPILYTVCSVKLLQILVICCTIHSTMFILHTIYFVILYYYLVTHLNLCLYQSLYNNVLYKLHYVNYVIDSCSLFYYIIHTHQSAVHCLLRLADSAAINHTILTLPCHFFCSFYYYSILILVYLPLFYLYLLLSILICIYFCCFCHNNHFPAGHQQRYILSYFMLRWVYLSCTFSTHKVLTVLARKCSPERK